MRRRAKLHECGRYPVYGEQSSELATIADLLLKVPPGRRGPVALCTLTFAPAGIVTTANGPICPLPTCIAVKFQMQLDFPTPCSTHGLKIESKTFSSSPMS